MSSRCDDIAPVERLVIELHGFERQLRTLFAASGRLSAALVDAQASQPIAAGSGHKVYEHISNAHAHIGQAVASVGEGHRDLERLRKLLGIDTTGYGDPHPKPSDAGFFTHAHDSRQRVG